MLSVGVIGFGYWGPNIVRNFMATQDVAVNAICDLNQQELNRARKLYPQIRVTCDYRDIIKASDIDIVAVITPVSTHFELAKAALEQGKHVFVEKPFTRTTAEAEELIATAKRKNLKIMVDHTFIFTGSVQKIKELLDDEILGKLYYFDSTRVSLGKFQPDTNVVWDLATHDFSIIDFVIKDKPVAVTTHGLDHVGSGFENLVYIILHFEGNFMAHITASWLSPVKIRSVLIGGEKKMLVWDDLEVDERIKVYDKGIIDYSSQKNAGKEKDNNAENKDLLHRLQVDYRSGDMISPRVDPTEALKIELSHFVECILQDKNPVNDGESGLRIVKMLEATDMSLKNKGKTIKL